MDICELHQYHDELMAKLANTDPKSIEFECLCLELQKVRRYLVILTQ